MQTTLQLSLTKRYTYADYLTWFDDKRRELLNGFIQLFAAPLRKHLSISSDLHGIVWSYLKEKDCEIYSAPFDVRFPVNGETENKEIYTVVQPDIVIVCDKNKLDRLGCIGSPDMIVEITSKSTVQKDVTKKYDLYEKHGVKEYWIVRPEEQTVTVFVLNKKGKYDYISCYPDNAKIPVNIFKGDLIIDLKNIFEEEEKEE